MNYTEMNHETIWLIVFVALTAFALLVQAIAMVAAFFLVRKTINTLQGQINEVRATALPMLNKTKETLDKIRPKIESIADDMADLSSRVRAESVDVQAKASDILERVHRQTSRVDAILTNALDGVEHASNVVSGSVVKPARKMSAFLSAAKAFLSVMKTGRKPGEHREWGLMTFQ
jgi:hypothetical protein